MSQKRNSLRIGDLAPDFEAQSTKGLIKFHNFIGDGWVVLFAHPAHNPVSTTELAYFQYLVSEFDKRNVKLIALAPDTVDNHEKWSKDIAKLATRETTIPIIEDKNKSISLLYDMLDPEEKGKGTVNSVRDIFIIDPKKRVRLIFSYPANVGASAEEVIRVIDCLQTPEHVSTPVGWVPGQQVLVDPKVNAAKVEADFDDVKNLSKNVILGTISDS